MTDATLAIASGPAIDAAAGGGRTLLPLRVAGLRLEIGGRRLIDDVTLTLGQPGLVVVMGPNGSGKSLLLRLLHGLIDPSSGTISWGGTVMGPEVRRRQAMVFQRPVLLRRSAAANIDFVLALKGVRPAGAAARRRDELLGLVGLSGQASQPARRLSGGEQQRLALARALATDPDVLFMDEPTASLDPASVQMIETIVRRARDEGRKVIFVTHDIGQAKRLADEIVFVHRGRIAEHQPAGRFFDQPASAVARAYLDGRIVV